MSLAGFSDADLYEKLGFAFPPTDRELEIRILFLRRNYSDVGNTPNPTLYSFYDLVYDHFFGSGADTEDMVEGYQNIAMTIADKQTPNPTHSDADGSGTVAVVSNIPYSRDKMNPILKQTIQRVVSIDSKYRNMFSGSINAQNSFNNNSTNFTIDLSEPLKDVLSIKLYSFQIPNSWYTIAKNYGANFFLLKGTSPGIDTGNFDYTVQIDAGNYTTLALIQAVNTSIQNLKTTYTDASFGNSDISMNPANTIATLTWDYTNSYDQSNYYLDWVVQPDPSYNTIDNGSTIVFHDIPGFLGFSKKTYYLSSLSTPSLDVSMNDRVYWVNSSNNHFIIQTIGLDGTTVDLSLNITLKDLFLNDFNRQSDIAAAVNNALQDSVVLDSKSSFTSDVSGSSVVYTFRIFFNKSNPSHYNLENYQIVFPTEDIPSGKPIWTGNNSCFKFSSLSYFLNDVVSERQILTDSFPVNSYPVIEFDCSTNYYVDPSNNYSFVCSDLSENSYTIEQYISGVNKAFSSDPPDPHFHFYNRNTSFFVDDISLNASFRFDFQIMFQTYEYYVDLSQTVFGLLYFKGIPDISNDYLYDLSHSSVISGTLTTTNNLYIPIDLSMIILKPKFRRNGCVNGSNTNFFPNHDLSGLVFHIPFISTAPQDVSLNSYYYSDTGKPVVPTLFDDISISLKSYFDSQSKKRIITDSTINYNPLGSRGIDISLNMNVQIVLDETYFKASLYDLSNSPSSWTNNFGFSSTPYDLSLSYLPNISYSQIYGTTTLKPAILIIDETNNFFYIRPFVDGLTTTTPGTYPGSSYNDIRIDISSGTYTTATLLPVIKNALKANPLTKKSSFFYDPSGGTIQYATFQFLIQKTFTAKDYSVVFYNPVSFYKCYNTDASIRNTTWDQTMGWMLGFRQTSYPLSSFLDSSGVAKIFGENTVNVNLFSYLLITLDDFNQCRLNDGLVSITKPDASVSLPSYAYQTQINCTEGVSLATGSTNTNTNNLTLNQVYALNQILAARTAPISQTFSEGPYIKDIFGIIPLKTAGLGNGQLYTDYGGSLGTQERIYFGPVNIRRLQVQLYNNQGSIMDLNNADWSFSFICEQLYQQNSGDPSAKKDT